MTLFYIVSQRSVVYVLFPVSLQEISAAVLHDALRQLRMPSDLEQFVLTHKVKFKLVVPRFLDPYLTL